MAEQSLPKASRTRRPETRPTEILEAALDAFSSRGFGNTSLDQVARAAGVTKGAIYHYFKGKEDLLLQALNHWLEESVLPGLEPEVGQRGPASARLRLIIRHTWDLWSNPKMADALRLIEGELVQKYPALVERWMRESVRPAMRVILDVVEEGKASGEIRLDLDAEIVVHFLMSGINKVAAQRQLGPLSPLAAYPSDRVIDSILDVFFRGVRS